MHSQPPWSSGVVSGCVSWHNALLPLCCLVFRYQVLAGVVEQRLLEPWLEHNKLLLAATSFFARTGNTFLGSLL